MIVNTSRNYAPSHYIALPPPCFTLYLLGLPCTVLVRSLLIQGHWFLFHLQNSILLLNVFVLVLVLTFVFWLIKGYFCRCFSLWFFKIRLTVSKLLVIQNFCFSSWINFSIIYFKIFLHLSDLIYFEPYFSYLYCFVQYMHVVGHFFNKFSNISLIKTISKVVAVIEKTITTNFYCNKYLLQLLLITLRGHVKCII